MPCNPETCDCLMCGTARFSLKLYDSCQPLRDIIVAHPELKDGIIEELGRAMTQEFAKGFYG